MRRACLKRCVAGRPVAPPRDVPASRPARAHRGRRDRRGPGRATDAKRAILPCGEARAGRRAHGVGRGGFGCGALDAGRGRREEDGEAARSAGGLVPP
ncbi:hypothetical protein BGLA2_970018 [Burkholderia gladioli]|nr:hypothetical protein BGLA2_970018 [Burkholderia gladioli]